MSDEMKEVRLGPIRRHPQVCHGALTFQGSRVFVDSLFELLGAGLSIDEICGAKSEYFPTVSVVQAQATLELALAVLEVISADPELMEAVRRADLDLAASLEEDWPKDADFEDTPKARGENLDPLEQGAIGEDVETEGQSRLRHWLAEAGLADLEQLEHHRCGAQAEAMEEHRGTAGPSPRDWGDAINHVVSMSGVWWAVSGVGSPEYVTPIRHCPWCGDRL